jgi:hypothetical protein
VQQEGEEEEEEAEAAGGGGGGGGFDPESPSLAFFPFSSPTTSKSRNFIKSLN